MSFIFSLISPFIKVFLISIIIKSLYVYYRKFLRKPYNLLERYGKDSYVLVTGATDGIGKEFCNQFAKLGFNLILVSRNEEKLKKVSSEFQSKYPNIKTEIIEFDFTKKTSIEDYNESFKNEKIQNLDISVLINNIGISQRIPFSQYTIEQISNTINVNIKSQSFLTHIFLNKFLSRKNKCAIISMSSYSANLPLVNSSMYCSSKIFDDYLLRSIAYENKGSNIDFISVKPQYVDTPSRKSHSKEFKPISSEDCVLGVLQDLGYDYVTNGHYSHCFKSIIFDYVPIFIQNFIRSKKSKSE